MEKYIAYCKTHNWEGMRRDSEEEAILDLNGHIELFPSENHNNSGINREEESKKILITESGHTRGSTYAKCNRNGCNFYLGKDSFEVGEDNIRIRAKAIPNGVRVNSLKFTNTSGGRSYQFTGLEVTNINGATKLFNKGNYLIQLNYIYTDTGGPREVDLYVWW